MTTRNFANAATATTLASSMTNVVTTMNLTSKTGWPTSFPFTAVIEPNTANQEIVDVTSLVSGNNFNVTRGVDGSTGVAHSSGVQTLHEATARDYSEANVHVNATGVVHGLTGSIVGTTDTQTLTNKTIAASSNTITGLTSSSGSYSVSGTGGGTGTATLVSTSVTVPTPCGRAKLTLHLTEIGPNEGVITWTLGGTAFKGSTARHVHHVSGSTINMTYTTWVDSPPTGSQTLSIALSSQATASTCSGDWLLDYSN